MGDQKAENILNLALETPEEERAQTEDLNVGYDRVTKSWEVIVTYSGNLKDVFAEQFPQVQMKELLGGFAILEIPETEVEDVLALEAIEYAEKPKRLYFAVNRAKAVSCILLIQSGKLEEKPEEEPEEEPEDEPEKELDDERNAEIDNASGEKMRKSAESDRNWKLSGSGVLVGIVDSGIDYYHEDFRNSDGSSRILYLYDQVLNRVFTKTEIDEALKSGSREEAMRLIPSVDPSGHGTAVAGIAAGNGRASGGLYAGAAYDADLVVVRLGVPDPDGFPRTTQVMEGVDFIVRKAVELNRPFAVNLSFGNSYGPHDGTGLLERFLDRTSQIGKSVFVIGAGNEGDKAGHASGTWEDQKAELSVAPYETGFSVQLWKHYKDDVAFYLTDPSGTTERIQPIPGAAELRMGDTRVLLYYGEPSPYSESQEIYFEFVPVNGYVDSGIWTFSWEPRNVTNGRYDLWLPSSSALNPATRFLRSNPDTTITIPATALRPISVGAYDDATMTYASFSGRGNTRDYQIPKPDLAAPGVNIIAPKAGGGYAPVTGTSFAAPLVTGAAALLMEWGIVNGNDPYLYGDKGKAYLKKGAGKLPGEQVYPNPRTGWGKLCVSASIPLVEH